jgi:hypothetical protein
MGCQHAANGKTATALGRAGVLRQEMKDQGIAECHQTIGHDQQQYGRTASDEIIVVDHHGAGDRSYTDIKDVTQREMVIFLKIFDDHKNKFQRHKQIIGVHPKGMFVPTRRQADDHAQNNHFSRREDKKQTSQNHQYVADQSAHAADTAHGNPTITGSIENIHGKRSLFCSGQPAGAASLFYASPPYACEAEKKRQNAENPTAFGVDPATI